MAEPSRPLHLHITRELLMVLSSRAWGSPRHLLFSLLRRLFNIVMCFCRSAMSHREDSESEAWLLLLACALDPATR